MIIVEGVDGTGKTTLVHRLHESFPELEVRPSIGNKHDPKEITRQAWEEARLHRPTVLGDRSRIISEYIYSPILKNRPCAYTPQEWCSFLGGFIERPQCVIFCWRYLDRIEENLKEEEQLANVIPNLRKLAVAYESMMEILDFMFRVSPQGHVAVNYNFDLSTPDQDSYPFVVDQVASYLKGATEW